ALFLGHRAGDGVGPLAHQFAGLLEHLRAVVDGAVHPVLHGPLGRGDGPLGFGPAAVGDLGDDLLGRRVDDAERAAVIGVGPLAVDEQTGFELGRGGGGGAHGRNPWSIMDAWSFLEKTRRRDASVGEGSALGSAPLAYARVAASLSKSRRC